MLVTLADYHLAGELRLRCRRCRRSGPIDLSLLAARYGWRCALAALPFRCERCGARGGEPVTHGRLDALGVYTRGLRSVLRQAGVLEEAEAACRAAGIELRDVEMVPPASGPPPDNVSPIRRPRK